MSLNLVRFSGDSCINQMIKKALLLCGILHCYVSVCKNLPQIAKLGKGCIEQCIFIH